ncbi:MAG: dynamin family protein [Saprospiraceae bacterium]|nr:dynamin family protein [Saprospiraceae bacterium]
MSNTTENKGNNNMLFGQIQRLRDRFNGLVNIFQAVAPFLPKGDEIREQFDNNQKMIDALNSPEFHVCFAGPYSTGKSTLINAVLGKDILPAKDIPTTACPTFIRKSPSDKEFGNIYYSSLEERSLLKESYLRDLAETIGLTSQRADELLGMDNLLLASTLDQEVTRFKASGKVLSNDSFLCLEYLLKEWDNKVEHVEKNKSIADIKRITEFADDKFDPSAILISRIDVNLCDLPYDSSIVLVDLPGLGSRNINHELITRTYAFEANTKAFIFIFAPKKLAESKTSKFIADINNNKRFLGKSFWVINMWDEVRDEEDERILESSFKDGLKNYNISFMEDRFFKTSALYKTTKPDSVLAKNVDLLREKFFTYLTKQIFEEFLSEAEAVYHSIYYTFKGQVDLLKIRSDNPDDILNDFIFEKADELFESWFESTKKKVEDTLISANDSLSQFDFLKDKDIKAIYKKFGALIPPDEALKRLKQTGFRRMDDHEARWIEFVENITKLFNATVHLRDAMRKRTHDEDIKDLIVAFRRIIMLNIIEEGFVVNIPQDMQDDIVGYVSEANLGYRLDGICDGIFLEYHKWRKWIEAELSAKDTNYKVLLHKANQYDINKHFEHFTAPPADPDFWSKASGGNISNLNLSDFSSFAVYFIQGVQTKFVEARKSEINQVVTFCLKNYFTDVSSYYEKLIEKNKKSVKKQIIEVLRTQDLNATLQIQIERIKTMQKAKQFFMQGIADPNHNGRFVKDPISL